MNWKACEKIHGGQFQVAVDFINQLGVESPELSALIYNVFHHQSAGWPHWSQGSLPDITITLVWLVWLVWQESKTNTLPPVLQEPGLLASEKQISKVLHCLIHMWTKGQQHYCCDG